MQKSHIILSEADQEELSRLLHQSDLKSKVFKRVTLLLELHKGKTIEEVRKILGLCYPTVGRLIDNYQQNGLECLQDKKQPGRPPGISGQQRAAITALACTQAPEGHARWSLRLLADKAVELDYCESISYVQVGRILKKTN